MHRDFHALLAKATGQSEFIVAVNADIRGFSQFCQDVESTDVAMYVKRVYLQMIDKYFGDATFFKSTGDGLILAIPYTEDTLADVVRNTINACLRLHVDFPGLCADDPMIPYSVPAHIGFGVTRGSACCLKATTKTIDFSGRILNYATRLMDLARPSGIVMDGQFGLPLLAKDVAEQFEMDEVYVRSIAEVHPVTIYYQKASVILHPRAKQPIAETPWKKEVRRVTLGDLMNSQRFLHRLEGLPSDKTKIGLKVTYPAIRKGRRQKGLQSYFVSTDYEYYEEAGEPMVRLDYEAIRKSLARWGVKRHWPVLLTITYPTTTDRGST